MKKTISSTVVQYMGIVGIPFITLFLVLVGGSDTAFLIASLLTGSGVLFIYMRAANITIAEDTIIIKQLFSKPIVYSNKSAIMITNRLGNIYSIQFEGDDSFWFFAQVWDYVRQPDYESYVKDMMKKGNQR